jgi:VWFA-related protein
LRRFAALAWLAALLAAAGLLAQDGSQPAPTPTVIESRGGGSPPENGAERVPEPVPIFRGEIDVSLIDIFVSVVDSDRQPVAGLTADDFRVFENGREVEITNFEAIEQQDVRAVPDAEAAPDLTEAPQERYVAILFDNPSLERKTRKRVLKALEDFIDEGLERDDQFMIAVNDDGLEVVTPFTSNRVTLSAALGAVAESPSGGDNVKKKKRFLKREVYSSRIYETAMNPGTNAITNEIVDAMVVARRLLIEIENVRAVEHMRINQALGVTDQLLRSLAGLEGRKSVLWIGEDLALRPALDIYNVYYSRAMPLNGVMTVDRPEVWGERMKLDREFSVVAANAQAAEATIFIVDASDRDREMAGADFGSRDPYSAVLSDAIGNQWTPGANLAEVRQRSEGGEFVAVATGGEAFGNTRNIPGILDSVAEHVSTYYYLGYRRSGPPDGKRHDLRVEVLRPGLRVRHHEQVLDRTALQRLADLAMSRLRLDLGDNDLDLAVQLDDPEPADKDTFVLPIQLTMPVDSLVLIPDADQHVGQILVAVAVLDEKGNTAPVQLMRLRLAIPDERMRQGAIAAQPLRLKMKRGSQRIAVSVRDEVSGIQASVAAPIATQEL